jgi:hypothetical protein
MKKKEIHRILKDSFKAFILPGAAEWRHKPKFIYLCGWGGPW